MHRCPRSPQVRLLVEDTFTTFNYKYGYLTASWDQNPPRIFCTWPFWAEEIRFLGNNTVISSLSIVRQLWIRITAWPNLGKSTKKWNIGNKVLMHADNYFNVVKVSRWSHESDIGLLRRHLEHSSNSRHLPRRNPRPEKRTTLSIVTVGYWLPWSPLQFEWVVCIEGLLTAKCNHHKWDTLLLE